MTIDIEQELSELGLTSLNGDQVTSALDGTGLDGPTLASILNAQLDEGMIEALPVIFVPAEGSELAIGGVALRMLTKASPAVGIEARTDGSVYLLDLRGGPEQEPKVILHPRGVGKSTRDNPLIAKQ